MNTKSTDITHRFTEMDYQLDKQHTNSTPEDLLIARETCELAGEVFEGWPVQGIDFGYKTPCSGSEVVEDMVRRDVVSREERALSRDFGRQQEASWLWLVRRRKWLINKELPNKLRFYQKTIKN
jgi:hypothetical protein